MEQYSINLISRIKYLQPQFTEYEIIQKIAYHFPRHIRDAIFVQGLQSIEQFLVVLTQAQAYNQFNENERVNKIERPYYNRNEQVRDKPMFNNRYTQNYYHNRNNNMMYKPRAHSDNEDSPPQQTVTFNRSRYDDQNKKKINAIVTQNKPSTSRQVADKPVDTIKIERKTSNNDKI